MVNVSVEINFTFARIFYSCVLWLAEQFRTTFLTNQKQHQNLSKTDHSFSLLAFSHASVTQATCKGFPRFFETGYSF